MNTATRTDSGPWYRQRWPWLLMVMPATAMALGFMLLYLAITSSDGLVVDDYYRQGRAIDQTIARSAHAAELGLAADVVVRPEEVHLQIEANEGVALPAEIVVTFIHPTRAGFDQVLRLSAVEGVFSGEMAPLTVGRWHIQIEDADKAWRLRGDFRIPERTTVRILPYDV